MVPGQRAVAELLAANPKRVVKLLLEPGRGSDELQALAREHRIAVELCRREDLAEVAGEANAQGALALARPLQPLPLQDLLVGPSAPDDAAIERSSQHLIPQRSIVVALDGVQDPQNLGAIVRSCEFFGARGVFWPEDRAVGLTPQAVRSSAGASERIRFSVVKNLARALGECKDAGFWVVGTVVDGGEPLASLAAAGKLPDALVLVLGSEERGIRRLTREQCDFLLTIPRKGAIGSLNVAGAAAILLSWLA